MSATASRVLFLGLDGGTMSALRPWFDRGLTPNLAALWQRSAFGTLRSSDPMVTPVAWTSFSTGCEPAEHGIHEFSYLESHDRTIRPNHSGRVRVPTLWQVLDAEHREVISLNLPMTYPPPRIRGVVVSGSDSPGLPWPFAQCPEFGREIVAEVPDYTHKIVWKGRPKTTDELRERASRNRAVFLAQAEAAERADAHSGWTALMVHYQNLDSLQHRLWPEIDPESSGSACRPEWVAEVDSCIRALDQSIGRLLDLASRRDAAVIALSDHGFGPCKALVNVNGMLRGAGLQRGLLYGTRFHYRTQRLGERLHRWLTRRAPGGPKRRLPRSVEATLGLDWKRTVAFAPFGQLSGCIFLNPRTTTPGASSDRAIEEIIEVCREARDPETGAPLYRDVFSTADRYDIDPADQGVADVLALSADGYQAQSKWGVSLHNALLRPDANLPGTHWRNGILAIDAPGVIAGERLEADLRDVAPTTLAMLGLAVPDFMTGRVIHEAFETPLDVRKGERPFIEDDPDLPLLLAAGFGAEST